MCLARAQTCFSSGGYASASRTPSLLAIMEIFGLRLNLTALLTLEEWQRWGAGRLPSPPSLSLSAVSKFLGIS